MQQEALRQEPGFIEWESPDFMKKYCKILFFSDELVENFMNLNWERSTKVFWHNENLNNLHIMTTVEELNKNKKPIIAIDKSLNKYQDKTLFPEKLVIANEQLKGVKLPSKNKTHDKKILL